MISIPVVLIVYAALAVFAYGVLTARGFKPGSRIVGALLFPVTFLYAFGVKVGKKEVKP